MNTLVLGKVICSLYRCAAPLLNAGRVLAIVTLLRGRRPLAPIFAVQMLLVDAGGDTHAEDDYRTWLTQAGFSKVYVEDLPGRERSLLTASR